jgi:hypothetical protein
MTPKRRHFSSTLLTGLIMSCVINVYSQPTAHT